MAEEIINRVAQSSLVTINLEEYYHEGERVLLDIKDWLFEEMILREKDFRLNVKQYDWSQYEGKNVAITCTVDAIVPTWAYMLISIKLTGIANKVVFGDLEKLEEVLYEEAITKIDPEDYRDAKVVIKGCSKVEVPVYAYVSLAGKISQVATSVMYGEPCSTVPLYKRSKK